MEVKIKKLEYELAETNKKREFESEEYKLV